MGMTASCHAELPSSTALPGTDKPSPAHRRLAAWKVGTNSHAAPQDRFGEGGGMPGMGNGFGQNQIYRSGEKYIRTLGSFFSLPLPDKSSRLQASVRRRLGTAPLPQRSQQQSSLRSDPRPPQRSRPRSAHFDKLALPAVQPNFRLQPVRAR